VATVEAPAAEDAVEIEMAAMGRFFCTGIPGNASTMPPLFRQRDGPGMDAGMTEDERYAKAESVQWSEQMSGMFLLGICAAIVGGLVLLVKWLAGSGSNGGRRDRKSDGGGDSPGWFGDWGGDSGCSEGGGDGGCGEGGGDGGCGGGD
jgi:hypothetical protein